MSATPQSEDAWATTGASTTESGEAQITHFDEADVEDQAEALDDAALADDLKDENAPEPVFDDAAERAEVEQAVAAAEDEPLAEPAAAASDAEPEEEIKGASTTYLIQQAVMLKRGREDVAAWIDLGEITARSGDRKGAIGTAMDRHDLSEGQFRAIPVNSAQILKPKVERKTVWS